MSKLTNGVVLRLFRMKKSLQKGSTPVTPVWRPRFAVVGFVLTTVAAGCTLTQRAPLTVQSEQTQSYCPFLGNSVCAKLTATTDKSEADLRYVNPNAQWSQYSKVLIEPVSYWGGDDTKLSAADQRTMTTYFSKVLHQQLSKKFQVVDQAGPGVMAISVALEDATAATPGLRSLSLVEPHVRAIATLKYLATGTFPFVGSAEAEAKITDSVTGQVLAAAVSKRVGGGSMKAADQWEWGDAENALTYWATQMANRLSSWTSGTATS
jgi:Protein of unknown function (DUF3313)